MRNFSCVLGSMPRSARYPRALAPARDASVASKNLAASSTTSCSVLRRSSRASASGDDFGTGTPAIEARRSTASGKVTPSVSITKSKMLPFLPEEKSNHAAFWSLTKNDAVFSLLNGESPFHSRPAFFRDTRRPTTSETGRRVFRSSRNSGEKRMGDSGLLSRVYPISRGARRRTQSLVLSRLFTGLVTASLTSSSASQSQSASARCHLVWVGRFGAGESPLRVLGGFAFAHSKAVETFAFCS